MTTTAKGELLKVAWIRNADAPVGKPALGRLNCRCGKAPESRFERGNGNVHCPCGTRYTWNGWIIKDDLMERFANTHPTFQVAITSLALGAGKPVEYVYGLWRQYSDNCQSADQSAILCEFKDWYKEQLKPL